MNFITKENLQQLLEKTSNALLSMARDHCWNKISDNSLYIISEDSDTELNSFARNKIRKLVNDKKTPQQLSALMPRLNDVYSDTYEFNLYIYKAKRDKTIIEITYRIKRYYGYDAEYKEMIKNSPPLLHCKVPIPYYAHIMQGKNKQFNINWELYPIDHVLRLFWHRLKYKFHRFF
ncbi:hypothetical protein LX99_00781 [Mucilaginibacter oryzae]|uniref:Uncharacterized protein n=1 Tax=Mucilaginibacter oryzae TaxID=468058 RepID=A0A316HIG9_9SPHI|nr:hypothetical protein [Mucilaginibacter oryzae]PWK80316.1 hypothetical protein LX99_00781 [Mucilaginibacter oryzae]